MSDALQAEQRREPRCSASLKRAVRKKLLAWHDAHQRDLPWRRTRDPYAILVSEIMLQQTRVAAVIPYYERFLALFPTASVLAQARETTVLRAWAGLGYYSRARNLQRAAAHIAKNGFPATYDDALALAGIGPYTAAAVMSIAYGQPHAAVDGNVRRVLARLFADNSAGQAQADALLDRKRPGDFNQAMMELGATVCTPSAPQCVECAVSRHCIAYAQKSVDQFPTRKVKRAQEDVRITWAWIERDGAILLVPPRPDGLWRGFWTLPAMLPQDATLVARVRHAVTFRKIEIEVYAGSIRRKPRQWKYIAITALKRYPVATPVRKALAAFLQETPANRVSHSRRR